MIISLEFDVEVLAQSGLEARDLVAGLLSEVEEEGKIKLVSDEMSNHYDYESKQDTGEEEDTFTVTFQAVYKTSYGEQEFIEKFENIIIINSYLDYSVEEID